MKRVLLTALILALVLALPAGWAARAQDELPPRCDATLVTLLTLAVRDYAYDPALRLDRFDYAEYRPLVEAATGVALPEYTRDEGPTAGQQAAEALQGTAQDLRERGLSALGEGLAAISDEAGALVDAGEEVFQAGQSALQAGVAAIEIRDRRLTLPSGQVPGEPNDCTILRNDLLAFLVNRLSEETGLE